MSGAWACRDCATKHGYGAGHGLSQGGWCAVGGHRTKERIEYYPRARVSVRRAEAVDRPAQAATQLALF
jgi:hypothetical protein